MRKIAYVFVLSVIFFQCQDLKKRGSSSAEEEIGMYPRDSLEWLLLNVNEVDVIGYDIQMSMNFKDKSAAYIVRLINAERGQLADTCKPLARLVFLANGTILKEADLYTDRGCRAVVFMKDNRPTHINVLSGAGQEFFHRFLPSKGPSYTEEDIRRLEEQAKEQGKNQ